MSRGPEDYRWRGGLETLLALDTTAFHAPNAALPWPILTVCWWVKAQASGRTQVMVNCGHRQAEEPGWSCFLHAGELVVSACTDAGKTAAAACPFPADGGWHHVAVVFDLAAPAVTAALDGSGAGWQPSTRALRPAAPPGGGPGLLAGGYTDAAGGHFDFTFGRRGSGLLDDLRVYARALAAGEIAGLAGRRAAREAGARAGLGMEERAGCPAAEPCAARITWSAPGDKAPARVRFAAAGAEAPEQDETGAPCATYLWTWPDGTRSVGAVVERDFAYAGSYRVRLDVIGPHRSEASTEADVVLHGPANPLRLRPVFCSGEAQYAAFRIPSIVRAANGDLVALAEGRVESASDATRTIHIVGKTSRDNGHSWGPLRVVARNIVDGVEYAAMNAAPVVDTVYGTGRIVLVFKKLECSEWEIAQGRGIMRTCCLFSDDHGVSWHGERDITLQVHRPYRPPGSLQDSPALLPGDGAHAPQAAPCADEVHDWRIQVPTLGHAIQLCGANPGADSGIDAGANPRATRGRILHIGSRTRGEDSVFASMNYAFWSDDLGETWEIGPAITQRADGSPARGLNEATVVELSDGGILVNSRNYRGETPQRQRAVTRGTFDAQGRLTFGPAYDDSTLVEPAVQASLLRCHPPDDPAGGLLLFANPAHPFARVNMTVRASYDEGATWPVARVVDRGPSAYSDLVQQADGDIGLLYERGNAGGIYYASFPLAWLADGREAPDHG